MIIDYLACLKTIIILVDNYEAKRAKYSKVKLAAENQYPGQSSHEIEKLRKPDQIWNKNTVLVQYRVDYPCPILIHIKVGGYSIWVGR